MCVNKINGEMESMKSSKIALIFVFLLLAGGILYANEIDNEENTADETDADNLNITFPKNVITIDAGQAAFLLLLTGTINLFEDDPSYIFCTAAQYERQIINKASVAVRFEYGIMDFSGDDSTWRMQSFSADVHGRYYPTKKNIFFLGGSLGYAAVLCDFSTSEQEIKPIAHYVKIGGKLGWRFDFKKPGGFVLEPAIGYSLIYGSRIKTGVEKNFPILGGLLNLMNDALAQTLARGFGVSLGLGYRF